MGREKEKEGNKEIPSAQATKSFTLSTIKVNLIINKKLKSERMEVGERGNEG